MIVVYGYGGELVPKTLSHLPVSWLEQTQQLGTGHAVKLVLPSIPDSDNVLVVYGDTPLITHQTITKLVDAAKESGFSLLTSIIDNPEGYGRIIRDENDNVVRIVEHKDASDHELDICEINTGMMVANAGAMKKWLDQLDSNNAQGEFYLTDIIELAVSDSVKIKAINPDSTVEICGINDRIQLAELERYYQRVQAHYLMKNGVTLMDPERFDLRGELETGTDVQIDVNVIIEGSVSIGNNVIIGANCHINNVDIADDTVILPNTMIENSVIGKRCRIGPFSRIRPETRLADDVQIGNFVELKKSEVDSATKINHLSYVGDSIVGKNVNIGAGSITCNYDGANKHQTIIEDDVFIGSDTQLIAPVTVGKGATIGAGTTVISNVEANSLEHNKISHSSIKNWKRPVKK
jgi:bifunctional UDP-N-acetylglucosamine pyrophosphorylase/glucosamine-1-phosphate N-acetyltransferase